MLQRSPQAFFAAVVLLVVISSSMPHPSNFQGSVDDALKTFLFDRMDKRQPLKLQCMDCGARKGRRDYTFRGYSIDQLKKPGNALPSSLPCCVAAFGDAVFCSFNMIIEAVHYS